MIMNGIHKETKLIINVMNSELRQEYSILDCKNIILTLTFIKRIDSLLKFSKKEIINAYEQNKDMYEIESILMSKSIDEMGNKLGFYNYSKFDINALLKDPNNIKENFIHYINCFSNNIRDILQKLDVYKQITTLSESNTLLQLVEKLSNDIDLSPLFVSNQKMGEIFEELIILFSQKIGKTAGEFYTPHDITELMIELLFIEENEANNYSKSIYDPACGIGEMLINSRKFLEEKYHDTEIKLYGQDINNDACAICKANMILNGFNHENITGPTSTLSDDQFKNNNFDYIISHPPFSFHWGHDKESIYEESKLGFDGRFGAGLPKTSDGQLLFIQHMISKMNNEEKTRIAVITTGSPLFTGDADSGESEIRKWIIENDYLESVIGLPKELFFSTSIGTYIWILTNQKNDKRKGKVQLIDVRDKYYEIKRPKSSKHNKITKKLLNKIINDYKTFEEKNYIKIFDNDELGYTEFCIEEQNDEKNFNFKERKKIPLSTDIEDYIKNEILKYNPNNNVNYKKNKIGYEINFRRLMFDEKTYLGDIEYPIAHLENIAYLERINKKNTNNYDLVIKYTQEKSVYYPHELSLTNLKQSPLFIGCKIKTNNILKDYLYYYLNSNKGLKHTPYFFTGLVMNLSDLKCFSIPLPDIKTQQKIVETCRVMEEFSNEIQNWKENYSNNILDYKSTLESYKEFSCSISFGDDGGVKDFCRNWRIIYQSLIWPLAYTYLKATKGSKNESTIKQNHLVLFEFLAAFNVIVLISGINNNSEMPKEIKNKLWELNNDNNKTWHMMHFGGWTTLYKRLRKIYRDYEFKTSINRDFLDELSNKKYEKLFQKLRAKERNPDAHSGLEDDIDVETKLDDLKVYIDRDIFNILNLYSGLKLYYISENIKYESPKKISYEVMSLNGPCDPPNWYKLTTEDKLEPHCLYLYDSLNNSFLKLDNDLIKFEKIKGTKQYGIYIYDSIDTRKEIVRYKCYQHKHEIIEISLNTEEDTFFKVSDEFKKDILKL